MRHPPLSAAIRSVADDGNVVDGGRSPGQGRSITIGFAGAIYDSNSRQLAELCRLVNENTVVTSEDLDGLGAGACGARHLRTED